MAPELDFKTSVHRSIEIIRSCGWFSSHRQQIKRVHKKSSVLNIIGSGSSINRLSAVEKNWLNVGDTLTFNLSHLLDIRPTYALMQMPLERRSGAEDDDTFFWSQYSDLTIESIIGDSERFRDTHFFLRTTSTIFARRRKSKIEEALSSTFSKANVSPLRVINIATPFEVSVQELCDRNIEFINDRKSGFSLKLGSTLPLAIMIGAALGYSKICLFGCDLLDSNHFYDDETYFSKFQGEEKYPAIWNPLKDSFEFTFFTDKSVRKSTQLEDVHELATWLMKNSSIEVRLINNDTAFSGLLATVDASWYR